MSAIPVRLTDQSKINEAIEKLKKRGLYDRCPRCGHTEWIFEILAILVSALPEEGNINVRVGSYAPVLSVTCKTCGVVFNHNLLTLGLWP